MGFKLQSSKAAVLHVFNALHDFWLSQTKDQHHERIVGKSLVFDQNHLSYILKYEQFDNGCHTGLMTKDYVI